LLYGAFVADLGNESDLARVLRAIGPPGTVDVIVDDGSHVHLHLFVSITALFLSLMVGGMYIIEDLATSYGKSFEGGGLGQPSTTVEFLKLMLDLLNSRHAFPSVAARLGLPAWTTCVRHMDCYTEVCVLVRGVCGEHLVGRLNATVDSVY
jgi:hypothetical protein